MPSLLHPLQSVLVADVEVSMSPCGHIFDAVHASGLAHPCDEGVAFMHELGSTELLENPVRSTDEEVAGGVDGPINVVRVAHVDIWKQISSTSVLRSLTDNCPRELDGLGVWRALDIDPKSNHSEDLRTLRWNHTRRCRKDVVDRHAWHGREGL